MAKAFIHPSAIIEAGAEIGDDVEVGPFCIISARSKIGARTKLASHVVLSGITTLGEDNVLSPFCSLGGAPQDLSYKNEDTSVVIGDRNTFREYVTVHRGTLKDDKITRIGHDNYFMVGSHIAHDCLLGNHIVMANQVALGGHVHVADHVNIGGLVGVAQRSRIGEYAFIGGCSVLRRDLPPYMSAKDFSEVAGPNLIGLKRAGKTENEIRIARELYKILYLGNQTTEKAIAEMETRFSDSPFARRFIDFVNETKIGVQR